ncbi:MAG TPA: malic enzyme-like NAD(P)-binding protein [Methanothrix sp.]|jgi:malate dehydrogenase (oxaloacetate-decarboxylating)|nr:NAD-dependent malic enzyme [Methanothrix sp.]HOV81311.1 malic enzyme-like NAD(P)-binding protein [Methanothrix sp.]HPC89067.1 malic enzyme-like NAD(P)-binding protein [Methanothrix sp.]HQE86958.1 malic enzyme-like NAD(P)-binding protein [Methanothrix sp.]HQI68456.1 malic enzyme-like NAD(P)-binding protein [Methanothrix sp.]
MSLRDDALEFHRAAGGKIGVYSKVPCASVSDLSLAYTPGVAEPCREIEKNPDDVYQYTAKGNLVAVVTDGTAVLGLGDVGALASIPVMEGKAILFKDFAGIDAFPIAVASKDPSVIVDTVARIEPVFGGINLEDISAPRCFEVEERLKRILNIPVFHDDQHGTAVVALAALINALNVVGKRFDQVRVAVSGAGAAGIAVTKFLYSFGVRDAVLCDSRGIISRDRKDLNPAKQEIAGSTNPRDLRGSLADAMAGADVFLGLSVGGIVTSAMVESMSRDAIVFAMANPVPEIMPDLALQAGARVVATGRSDFPNQVNNVLGFPGIFRGALDVRASEINEAMKVAASRAIAGLVESVSEGCVIPSPLDRRVVPAVAAAVARAAIETGVARVDVSPEEVARNAEALVRKLDAL